MPLFQIERSIIKAGKDHENKRVKLRSVMMELIRIIETHKGSPAAQKRGSVMVEGLLRTEGTSEDLERDCRRMVEQINHGECLILVAGKEICVEWGGECYGRGAAQDRRHF